MNNKSQKTTISICFEEDCINHLFSELLKAKGLKTRVVTSPKELSNDKRLSCKIITEPQFVSFIPEELKPESLIVGNKESLKGLLGVCLSRPLTEQKIESAILRFLG